MMGWHQSLVVPMDKDANLELALLATRHAIGMRNVAETDIATAIVPTIVLTIWHWRWI